MWQTWGRSLITPSPLHAALSDFMDWMLQASHNSSCSWRHFQARLAGIQKPANEFQVILNILLASVGELVGMGDARVAAAQLSKLPTGFLSRLCSLAHEYLGSSHFTVATGQRRCKHVRDPQEDNNTAFLTSVVDTVIRVCNIAGRGKRSALLDTVSTTAVIQLLELAVVLEWENSIMRPPRDVLADLKPVLTQLLNNRRFIEEEASYASSGSLQNLQSTQRGPRPRSSVMDCRLIWVLCGQLPDDEQARLDTLILAFSVLLDWEHLVQRKIAHSDTSKDQCIALADIAHLCSLLALKWMHNVQFKRQRKLLDAKLDLMGVCSNTALLGLLNLI